jgi:hypothetical protein
MTKYGLKAIDQASKDFDIPMKLGVMYRENYLHDQVVDNFNHTQTLGKQITGANDETREFILSCIQDYKKETKSILKEIDIMQHYKEVLNGSLNPIMIERAREYPISKLVDSKKNLALCVNHAENNPSMNIKNNFAYCHSCGWHGDTIEVYRKLYGVSFVDAVKALQ